MLGEKGDNSATFTAFLLVNAGIAVGGLFTMSTGAYAMTEKGGFDWLSTCFLLAGLGMLIAAAIAFHSKDRLPLLRHLIICTAVLFAIEIAFTYAVLNRESYDSLLHLPDSAVVRFVPLACCILLLLSLLVGAHYHRTLQMEKELQSPLRASV